MFVGSLDTHLFMRTAAPTVLVDKLIEIIPLEPIYVVGLIALVSFAGFLCAVYWVTMYVQPIKFKYIDCVVDGNNVNVDGLASSGSTIASIDDIDVMTPTAEFVLSSSFSSLNSNADVDAVGDDEEIEEEVNEVSAEVQDAPATPLESAVASSPTVEESASPMIATPTKQLLSSPLDDEKVEDSQAKTKTKTNAVTFADANDKTPKIKNVEKKKHETNKGSVCSSSKIQAPKITIVPFTARFIEDAKRVKKASKKKVSVRTADEKETDGSSYSSIRTADETIDSDVEPSSPNMVPTTPSPKTTATTKTTKYRKTPYKTRNSASAATPAVSFSTEDNSEEQHVVNSSCKYRKTPYKTRKSTGITTTPTAVSFSTEDNNEEQPVANTSSKYRKTPYKTRKSVDVLARPTVTFDDETANVSDEDSTVPPATPSPSSADAPRSTINRYRKTPYKTRNVGGSVTANVSDNEEEATPSPSQAYGGVSRCTATRYRKTPGRPRRSSTSAVTAAGMDSSTDDDNHDGLLFTPGGRRSARLMKQTHC